MDVNSSQNPPESDSRKVSSSREDSNIQQGHQQQQQELATRTISIALETIGASQTSTAKQSP
jgi:hypothetical protein